ncbi:DUF4386 domain-containing protein [Actinoplanes subtropicus]|uniref:DUF4386 domain-containing protein n=1 Tax=Actinoplanes subtropicus TaxID=543632 RepID=UPI000A0005AA|nr:DUF4386 domain-containing protein [Actinoplanes subtropicus]
MPASKTSARLVGVLFIAASATAVAGGSLLLPMRRRGFLTTGGSHAQLVTGALLEVALALAVVAIAALLLPTLRDAGEGWAVLYTAIRTIEGLLVLTGATSALVMTSLIGSGGPATLGAAVLQTREWAYHLGTVLVFAASAIVLNALLLRGGRVPRWLAWWGLAGGCLLLLRGVLELYGPRPGAVQAVCAVPIGVQEMVFAGWLIVKGYRR